MQQSQVQKQMAKQQALADNERLRQAEEQYKLQLEQEAAKLKATAEQTGRTNFTRKKVQWYS